MPRSASLLLESGDGFGLKALELRALLVEVLEGATTLEEADGAVARRGASGSTASGAGARSPPRRLPLLSRSEGSGKQLNDFGNAGVLAAVVGLVGSTAGASGGGGARGGAGWCPGG